MLTDGQHYYLRLSKASIENLTNAILQANLSMQHDAEQTKLLQTYIYFLTRFLFELRTAEYKLPEELAQFNNLFDGEPNATNE